MASPSRPHAIHFGVPPADSQGHLRLTAALADRYRLDRELGRGGMAMVWLAHDLRHDRPVALKVLHAELGAALGPERFLREIRVAARLQHPHILTVLDSGDAAGRLWYAMPLVEGETVRARIERGGRLPLDEALRITREVAEALDFAHAAGIVHRDVKPENILISAAHGHALLADFGIAKAAAESGDRLTGTGITVGTPHYMSPEQASGDRVDHRSDIYSLACVTYEMLAGEPPFTGPTAQAVIAKRMATPASSMSLLRPGLPSATDRAVLRALAVTPSDRFAAAGEFARALAATEAPAPAPATSTADPVPSRRWMRLLVIVGTLLAAAALLAWLLGRAGGSVPGGNDVHSLAVLPFVNAGGDTADAYIADGIADELTAALGRVPAVRLAARNSAFRFRGGDTPTHGRDGAVVRSVPCDAVLNAVRGAARLRAALAGAGMRGCSGS